MIALATDGIEWQTYIPKLTRSTENPCPEDVALEPVRSLKLTDATLSEFYIWLTGLLFRPQRIDPTSEQFAFDFGAQSEIFVDSFITLTQAWELIREKSEIQVAYSTWEKYLTITYGSLREGLDKLFLKHTYLACLARLLVWAALSHGKIGSSLHETVNAILSGSYFESKRIANLVEDDFFHWVLNSEVQSLLEPIWERLLSQMSSYDLTRLNQDVLKGVYQELVDPEDRHDLGEYYTPEWLCEKMVSDVLPESGWVSVLDPTCGSGSFLRAAISHLISHNHSDSKTDKLAHILESVVGIDIHPLAVIIAKATYLLAVRDLLTHKTRPIQVPVYLADALFLPQEVRQMAFGDTSSYQIRFGEGRKVHIPEELVTAPDLFDPAIAACARLAAEHAKKGKESANTLDAYLRRAQPAYSEPIRPVIPREGAHPFRRKAPTHSD